MKLLPFHRFEINSPLDRQAALASIAEHAEPKKWIRIGWNEDRDDRFEGDISDQGFRIRRVTGRRDDTNPIIEGTIDLGATGSVINIRMRPTINALGFLLLAPCVPVMVLNSPSDSSIKLGSIFFVILSYAVIIGLFWLNATKQERTLRMIFRDF